MSIQASTPTTCSRCFVPFSKEVKPYGRVAFSIDCIRCTAKSIFHIAGCDREALLSVPRKDTIKRIALPDYHVTLIDSFPCLQKYLTQTIITLADSIFEQLEKSHENELKQQIIDVHENAIDFLSEIEKDLSRQKGFQVVKGENLIHLIKQAVNLQKTVKALIEAKKKVVDEVKNFQDRVTSTAIAWEKQKLKREESLRQIPANQREVTATTAVEPVVLSSKAKAAAEALSEAIAERERLDRRVSFHEATADPVTSAQDE